MKYNFYKIGGMIPLALPIVWIAPAFKITGTPRTVLLLIGIGFLLFQMFCLLMMIIKTKRGEFE